MTLFFSPHVVNNMLLKMVVLAMMKGAVVVQGDGTPFCSPSVCRGCTAAWFPDHAFCGCNPGCYDANIPMNKDNSSFLAMKGGTSDKPSKCDPPCKNGGLCNMEPLNTCTCPIAPFQQEEGPSFWTGKDCSTLSSACRGMKPSSCKGDSIHVTDDLALCCDDGFSGLGTLTGTTAEDCRCLYDA